MCFLVLEFYLKWRLGEVNLCLVYPLWSSDRLQNTPDWWMLHPLPLQVFLSKSCSFVYNFEAGLRRLSNCGTTICISLTCELYANALIHGNIITDVSILKDCWLKLKSISHGFSFANSVSDSFEFVNANFQLWEIRALSP